MIGDTEKTMNWNLEDNEREWVRSTDMRDEVHHENGDVEVP